jgi:hypothetical protein
MQPLQQQGSPRVSGLQAGGWMQLPAFLGDNGREWLMLLGLHWVNWGTLLMLVQ